MTLEELGWAPRWEALFEPFKRDGLMPARVAVEHKAAYGLYTGTGEVRGTLAGRLRHEARGGADLPAVGDWVAAKLPTEGDEEAGGTGGTGGAAGSGGVGGRKGAVIHAILPRASKFSRRAAGKSAGEQVVAANVDVVLVMAALTEIPNQRKLERYISVALESGSQPVVLLSKADLVDAVDQRERELAQVALGVPVIRVSTVTGEGLESIRGYLGVGKTLALLGPSGVGKSSLVNALLGSARQQIGAVRDDGKGRHTTTRRELIVLPGGGVLLDTPGLRELQLWEADSGVAEAFGDIAGFASECRFRDCAHTGEPGCAVRAAVDRGELSAARLDSYHKLQAELRHVEAETDPAVRRERKRGERIANKALKTRLKEKNE